ncbi:hypothetical protein N431DRAFT_471767 [Stipitochalara longipes BDJ]|nr:hypothetical protein N431DRAFT_471767 [Stipitochalara longipes BDJ]
MSASDPTSNTSTDSVHFTEFTLFRKLPTELRLRIWKLALPGPRTIAMWKNTHPLEHQARDKLKLYSNGSGLRPSPLMHACSESRGVFLQHYEAGFANFFQGKPVYVDWDRDCIYFDNDSTLSFFIAESPFRYKHRFKEPSGNFFSWQQKVRHLTIGMHRLPTGRVVGNMEACVVGYLRNLRTLLLEQDTILVERLAPGGFRPVLEAKALGVISWCEPVWKQRISSELVITSVVWLDLNLQMEIERPVGF